jgi:F0F1-type ATP synthase membrane subunit a
VAVLAIFGYAVAAYVHDHQTFACQAHLRAAFTLFGFIVLVVLVNAIGRSRDLAHRHHGTAPWLNAYTVIFALMVLGLVATVVLRSRGWGYWVLFAEAVELGLFLVFWVTQSIELWNRGLRTPQRGSRDLFPQASA